MDVKWCFLLLLLSEGFLCQDPIWFWHLCGLKFEFFLLFLIVEILFCVKKIYYVIGFGTDFVYTSNSNLYRFFKNRIGLLNFEFDLLNFKLNLFTNQIQLSEIIIIIFFIIMNELLSILQFDFDIEIKF